MSVIDGGAPTLPAPADLDAEVRAVLTAHWQDAEGFTVPNAVVYPHQWLWDSCFHAVIWAHLGSGERAVDELRAALAHQGPDGFVPHMTYWRAPGIHAELWGRRDTSCITQPPMYGHAVAELVRRGVAVPDDVVVAAAAGLRHLLGRRRQGGLVAALHPWETGCDDSPRWDAWCPGPWSRTAWRDVKGQLVASLRFAPDGQPGAPGAAEAGATGPIGNDDFHPGSACLSALVAFNAQELVWATGPAGGPGAATLPAIDRADLEVEAAPLVAALELAWDARSATWADAPGGEPPSATPSRRVRTAEALLPLLVVRDAEQLETGFGQLVDDAAFGGSFGPAQVHRGERCYDPETYWRGPTWPQLAYLLWLAARRRGRDGEARVLAERFVAGAVRSGFAEHWHPDTGSGQGAQPQSWTGLAAVTWAATVGAS